MKPPRMILAAVVFVMAAVVIAAWCVAAVAIVGVYYAARWIVGKILRGKKVLPR